MDDECPNGEGTTAISIIPMLTFNPAGPEISKLDEARRCARGNPRGSLHRTGGTGRFFRAQIISRNYVNHSPSSPSDSSSLGSRLPLHLPFPNPDMPNMSMEYGLSSGEKD